MAPVNGRGRPSEGDLGTRGEHVHDESIVRCWLCGRALTAEPSRLLGIGPRCWAERMGGAA